MGANTVTGMVTGMVMDTAMGMAKPPRTPQPRNRRTNFNVPHNRMRGLSTGLIWSLRQLFANSPSWRATHTLWIWCAGTLLAGIQLLPFSKTWLDRLSPEHARLLTLWGHAPASVFPAWTTLSFQPAETTSG